MTTLRIVLGDQLCHTLSALDGLDPVADVVLMMEVADETTYVRHHKQKIVLVLSGMRHFAQELRARGVRVDYVELEDAANTGSFTGEVARAARRHGATRIIATEPGEWRVEQAMLDWADTVGCPVQIRADTRFLCSRERFAAWAAGRAGYRMEVFYRHMRRHTGLLMEYGKPAGGQWNYDLDNRKRLPRKLQPPQRRRFAPDPITRDVMALVGRRFADHFGDLDAFGWPVTRAQALAALDAFVADALPAFGDYQDAMRAGEPFLYHAQLSTSLNLGLLEPGEVCERIEAEWQAGRAPLNAAEGFIRQVLGWREYIRGVYWHLMPRYVETNHLGAERPLPWFYWSGETDMRCLADAIGATRRHAYAHHIQRLMVTGNFALLAGIAPREVEEWYLVVYADAYEWVELPNTHGLALFADGGLFGSKPYAASGAYIDRMSDLCAGCRYDPAIKTGPGACPFNLLYWDFLMRNRDVLEPNPRMAMPYRALAGLPDEHRARVRAEAAAFLDGLSVPQDATSVTKRATSSTKTATSQLGLDLA